MLSTESWPRSAVRLWSLTRRFQKFLTVGAVGLAVNQGMLYLLAGVGNVAVAAASPVAIFVSMVVTFTLNELWTWRDRGSGRVLHRGLTYGAINSGGLLINWGVLVYLEDAGMHYLVANLCGAFVAAMWNFSLNHVITWRD